MKKLEPRLIQEYRCDFCNKKYRSKRGCAIHEDKCYRNPKRNCETCQNEGYIDDPYNPRVCWACMQAEELGGKSYIEK